MPEENAQIVARLRAFLARAEADPRGLLKAATVFAAGALASLALWYPLGLPSEVVRNVIAEPTAICRFGDIFSAAAHAGTPRMYACSFLVAILTMAGPIVLLVLAFLYRAKLVRLVTGVARGMPSEARFLVAPLTATLLFATAWSGSHYTTAWNVGLLPQTLFPGIVGLFAFAVGRWGAELQRRFGSFFDLRDRYPLLLRVAAALLVPLALSLILTLETRVSLTALKEQIVVMAGLAAGFLALAPRSGDVMAGVGRGVAAVAQQVNAETRRGISRVRGGRE